MANDNNNEEITELQEHIGSIKNIGYFIYTWHRTIIICTIIAAIVGTLAIAFLGEWYNRKFIELGSILGVAVIIISIALIHIYCRKQYFIECENGVLYAPYSPDNNITDLLAEHFKHRLSCEKFVIHDIKRKLATIYDGNSLLTGKVGNAEIYVSEREKEFENLWKKYYKSVNIESRPHTKQMKGSMPVRYWKFLPEKQD